MRIVIYYGRSEPIDEGPYPYILLYQDNWDDFGFTARFVAELRLSEEDRVDLGGMRIAVGTEGFRANVPETLTKLPRSAVSMGESIAYYRKLRYEVPDQIRARYFKLMRDIILNPDRRAKLEGSRLWENSFMRLASSRHALKRAGWYFGLPTEDAAPPEFKFSMQVPGAAAEHHMQIDFGEYPELPHRTMLLIGRNGTGKTRCLAGLVSALVPEETLTESTIVRGSVIEPMPEFSRIIAVSYNAFDEFPRPRQQRDAPRSSGLRRKSRHSYKYCGLRNEQGNIVTSEVGAMLNDALAPVAESSREDVLLRVLARLLGENLAGALLTDEEREDGLSRLSAGQRLVAAIFTNIIGFIEEGSLLLIDEPETHLHPGLLSSVIASLDDVLNEYDSYAIVATHSPVLLQQVPSPFVRIFRRIEDVPIIEPLEIESFGEDLGELSRLVLGLADPERDFTDTLTTLMRRHGSAAEVEALFPDGLGLQARAYLYGLEDDEEGNS